MTLWALGAGLIALAGGLHAPGSARAADSTVTVFTDVLEPGGYRDVPGASVRLAAAPGQRYVLHADRFAMRTVEPLTGRDYLGTTTGLFCSAEGKPNGAHYGNNVVPVLNETVEPAVRWVFEAPHTSGVRVYTCTVAVDFYSSNAPVGTDVRVTSLTGRVVLHAEGEHGGVAHWGLPATLDPVQQAWDVVSPGATAVALDRTYEPVSATRPAVAVRQDAQLSTCKRQTPYRACPIGSHQYSEVSTWVQAQPVDRAGGVCGPPLRGPVSRARISAAEHHRTMPNALELRKRDLPAGCERLRLSLHVQVRDGDFVLVHGGWSTAGRIATAYSHGYAYEYRPGSSLADRLPWAAPVTAAPVTVPAAASR
ncbi:hypothetical protein [Streptomyces sp. NRRL S-118]|uniref:hypothetical protein n=1 Tax=Streptomyces sp. NRRL S-118 TaxID=1463881 RepID=UPI00131DE835|nr:hypothetical protein [Streptomyces sp. NRRL S-118]